MTQPFRQQRLQRRKLSPLQCIVYIVGFLLLQLSVTGIRTYDDRLLEPLIDNCVFSDTAITPDRLARTERAIQVGAFPSATLKCAHSSGTMRIVKSKHIRNICWYANDYLRIIRRVPRSKRRQAFIVCDRDCRRADSTVFSIAKSREILHDRDRTVSLVPVNVGRHFKWVPRALRDPWSYDRKLSVALWRGVSTSECWELDSKLIVNRPECARRNLAVRWSLDNSTNIDVGITDMVQLPPDAEINFRALVKSSMHIKQMLKYKYIISVEGNDVATNLKWALASNSVVLMPPPTRESFILEGLLQPWVHYVPLQHNMEDLIAKIDYCERNVSHCRQISKASTQYMQAFSSRGKLFHLGARVYEKHFEKLAMRIERLAR